MSRFQTNILFGGALIAGLRYYFCVGLLNIDTYVGVLGIFATFSVAIWMGRKQPGWGFVGIILSFITAISFVFSAIPVYQFIPKLDTFYATQIPRVLCSENTNGIVQVNRMDIDMRDICTRGSFPILANQEVVSSISGDVLIDLAMGNSAIIGNGFKGYVVRSYDQDRPFYTLRMVKDGSPKTITTIQTSSQLRLQNEYKDNLEKYLATNYPWKWSYAPVMTKIALGKMRVLALLDWRYNDRIRGLEFYMEQIQ